jgi:DNA polymerase-3 subunit alpha
VKRVGLAAMQDLVRARDAEGPVASLSDFAARVEPRLLNKMQLENLAKAGAFDSLEPNRARLVQGAEAVLRAAQEAAERRTNPTRDMFGAETTPVPLRLPEWLVQWMAEQAETPAELIEAALLKAHKLRPPRAP